MNATPFNKTNFFIFLIEFGFSLLFLFTFVCIHYGITNSTKLGKKLQKSRMFNFWYFFFFGFILSWITFVVSQISSIALGSIGMPLTILGLLYAMTIFYNKSVQIGAIIPTFLWVLYQYNGFTEFNLDWLIRLIVVLVMAGVAITTTFIKWKKWPTFLISCSIALLLILVILLSNINEYTTYYCIAALISILSTIFYYAVIGFINKWLTHVSKMARQGAYVDKYYLIPTALDEYFVNHIHQHNLTQALVLSFNIISNEKDRNKALDNIYQIFKDEKPLFFKSAYGTYGLILSNPHYQIHNLNKSYLGNHTKLRDEDDNLKYLEKQVSSLNTEKIIVNAYVSIYGVHSCQLEDLLRNNQYAFKHDDYEHDHNVVQLFNSNLTNQEINDDNSFVTLSQKLNLNDITVQLELLRMNKSRKIYVCPRYYWPKMLTCDVNVITGQFGATVANSLLRYLASKSLELYVNNEQYQQYPILIYYPIDQLNNNIWSINAFIKKLNLFGVDRTKIILSFDVSKYKVWPRQVLNNLKDLEKRNIKYMLVDINNIKGIKNLNPFGVILNKHIANNKQVLNQAKQLDLNIL
ncbi:MAG: hypothetical protein ACOQNV_02535 [Mycoplasmoidaceae bacterium]